MTEYLIRLDDACPKRDIAKWDQMETLLDKYHIKPLVAVIPDCKDPQMEHYSEDKEFWRHRVSAWQAKGWTLAMHGFEHRYVTKDGGINPVNRRSEFAGLSYEEQTEKICQGYSILKKHGITPGIFVAPSHTFDKNTLRALKNTPIRIISDTVANDVYKQDDFYFIPQQSGRVRPLPFKLVTFCYHPNVMTELDFSILEKFLILHSEKFNSCFLNTLKDRKRTLWEYLLQMVYLYRHIL